MASTTAATAIYKYTYTLGRSLYVPLTSRCNSIPLPQTRGPGFVLPREVAAALMRVRDCEQRQLEFGSHETFQKNSIESGEISKDTDENNLGDCHRVKLPPFDTQMVCSLYNASSVPSLEKYQHSQDGKDLQFNFIDDSLQPTISTLVSEVISRLETSPSLPIPVVSDIENDMGPVDDNGSKTSTDADYELRRPPFDQVVIAGEGEPTLRMEALLAVSRAVQTFGNQQQIEHERILNSDEYDYKASNDLQPQDTDVRHIPIRVITNGLCYGIPNFGYLPNYPSTEVTDVQKTEQKRPISRHVVLRDMMDAGITRLSVALNTANRHEYDVIMSPCCYAGGSSPALHPDETIDSNTGHQSIPTMPGTAHDLVCEFILEAARLGFDVEVTGIARSGVDQKDLERFSRMLLSAGDSNSKGRNAVDTKQDKRRNKRWNNVRWREYFG